MRKRTPTMMSSMPPIGDLGFRSTANPITRTMPAQIKKTGHNLMSHSASDDPDGARKKTTPTPTSNSPRSNVPLLLLRFEANCLYLRSPGCDKRLNLSDARSVKEPDVSWCCCLAG